MSKPSKLLDDEMSYKLLMQIAQAGLENGFISEEEFKIMQAEWIKKYNPKISKLVLDI